jgi:hypothetical protein
VAVGFDDFLAALFFLPMVCYSLMNPNSVIFKGKACFMLVLWISIIITGIIFGIWASCYHLDRVHFPTEMWQYIKRMVFFYLTLYLAYTQSISPKYFLRMITFILIVALLVGIFQILPISIGEHLSSLYARNDRQLERLIHRSFAMKRVYGVAGFSTAWGGFSMFAVSVGLALLLPETKVCGFMAWTLLILATINVFFSGSRVSIVTACTLIPVTAFLFFRLSKSRKKYLFLLKSLCGTLLIGFSAIYFLSERINFILFRFQVLLTTQGGSRTEQISQAVNLLNNWITCLIGVGNATQRQLAISHGAEVEPVYLLVNYGILGLFLRYGILLLIFFYAFRLAKISSGENKILALASILSIVGYAIFSLGYFFFQELYVGLLPWLLFGWTAGTYFRLDNFLKMYRGTPTLPNNEALNSTGLLNHGE